MHWIWGIALLLLVGCNSSLECLRNSDCAPGRFCSQDYFCEYQCRDDLDCDRAGACSCDRTVGLCVKAGNVCCTAQGRSKPLMDNSLCLPDAGSSADSGDASGGAADMPAAVDGK